MIRPIKTKDRSMVARMAGNIVGPIFLQQVNDFVEQCGNRELPEEFFKTQAANAVLMALAIVEEVGLHIENNSEEKS